MASDERGGLGTVDGFALPTDDLVEIVARVLFREANKQLVWQDATFGSTPPYEVRQAYRVTAKKVIDIVRAALK